MSRCLIIINPVSGGGRARRYVMELQWQLSSLFDRMEVKFTRQAGDATRFAIEASNEGVDAIFCMGGDGTINETVNGIVRAGGRAKFGFIPIGTVNDMSRALGISLQPPALFVVSISAVVTLHTSATISPSVLSLKLWLL